jgi:uncharacterized protein YbaR (Trm112 family)
MEEKVLTVEQQEKIQRLEYHRCPICLQVNLSMLCWPVCRHKICYICAYRTVRASKPHGSVSFQENLKVKFTLSYRHRTITCPMCRTDQSSMFSDDENKLLSGFLFPVQDWKEAMEQRIKDIEIFDPVQARQLFQTMVTKCMKCPLEFMNLEQCILHMSRCSENSIFCPFCQRTLFPISNEKTVAQRLQSHVLKTCQYMVKCNVEGCLTTVALCKLQEHRKVHAELLLLGAYISDGRRKFKSLQEIPNLFAGSKWEIVQEKIKRTVHQEKEVMLPADQTITSKDEPSFDNRDDRKQYEFLPRVIEEPQEQEEQSMDESSSDSEYDIHDLIVLSRS